MRRNCSSHFVHLDVRRSSWKWGNRGRTRSYEKDNVITLGGEEPWRERVLFQTVERNVVKSDVKTFKPSRKWVTLPQLETQWSHYSRRETETRRGAADVMISRTVRGGENGGMAFSCSQMCLQRISSVISKWENVQVHGEQIERKFNWVAGWEWYQLIHVLCLGFIRWPNNNNNNRVDSWRKQQQSKDCGHLTSWGWLGWLTLCLWETKAAAVAQCCACGALHRKYHKLHITYVKKNADLIDRGFESRLA